MFNKSKIGKGKRNDQQNIDDETKERQKQGKPLFVPYIMAGANGLERLPAEIELLTTHGAAAIEIGVPFSDPVADGAVIQAAGMQALANGTTLKRSLLRCKRSILRFHWY